MHPLQPYEIQSTQHDRLISTLQELVQNNDLQLNKDALDAVLLVVDEIVNDAIYSVTRKP